MSFQPFLVGDYRAGLQQNLDPWKLPGEAFQTAENMDLKDGIISRRLGYELFAPFTHLAATIFGATMADPVVITTDGDHGLSDGDEVIIRSVTGMVELNSNRYVITDVTAKTFELDGVDGSAFTAHDAGTGKVYVVSQHPIMGMILHRDTNDDEDLIVADTLTLGKWNNSSLGFDQLEIEMGDINNVTAADPPVVTTAANHGLSDGDKVRVTVSAGMTEINDNVYIVANKTATTFELQGETASAKAYTGGAATGKVYLISGLLSGGTTNYFSWVNYRGSVYAVNGVDRLLKYDGTSLTRPAVDFTGGAATDALTGKMIFTYKERLIILSSVESGTNQKQRARFSVPALPAGASHWHDQNSGGTGGFVDAPTGEPIVSAAFLQDNLIVFFRKSVWMLRYTGNGILPFRWELLNSTRKTEASFGTVKFDKFVTAMGSTGILGCNGTSIDRLDMNIPEFMLNVNADLINNSYAYKFEEFERVWMSYAANNEEEVGHALIYHFEDQGWTTHDFAFENKIGVTGITEADPGVVTTDGPHGLSNDDRISFEDVGGMTEVNGNVYVVANKTSTTFELEGVDTSSGFTTYTSGGKVRKGHAISCMGEYSESSDDMTWVSTEFGYDELDRVWNDGRFQVGASMPLMGDSEGDIWILERGGADRAVDTGSDITGLDFTSTLKTKRYNPFTEQGVNAELGYVDILFSRDSNADLDLEFYVDAEPEPYEIDGQSPLTIDLSAEFGNADRVWKRVHVGAVGAWHELQMKTSGQDKYVDIHAMIFWMRPAGRLELHA